MLRIVRNQLRSFLATISKAASPISVYMREEKEANRGSENEILALP